MSSLIKSKDSRKSLRDSSKSSSVKLGKIGNNSLHRAAEESAMERLKLFNEDKASVLNRSATLSGNLTTIRRQKLFRKYPALGKEYGILTENELKERLKKEGKYLFYTDIFCSISNLIVVTWLYFDHFDFIYNNYEVSPQSNTVRIICLVISAAVCLAIFYRFYKKFNFENLRFLLNKRNSISRSRLDIKHISLEILIHLLQPYPDVAASWEMDILGNTVKYSVNMILFAFSVLRVYVIVKLIKYWNLYTNERSHSIFKFFNNKSMDLFLFKANLKYYGIFAIGFIFCVILYLFGLVFKIFENYDADPKAPFSWIWNCLWYIIVTMTTIGFGDYVPKTMIGRMIGVLGCIIGIFLLSLITVTLLLYLTLENDSEIKVKLYINPQAYNDIDLIHTKGKKDNFFWSYFDSFIKYKINRVRKLKYNENLVYKFFVLKNRLKIAHEKNYLRVLASTKTNMSTADFCKNVKENWGVFMDDIKTDFRNDIITLAEKSEFFVDNTLDYTVVIKDSKNISFKIANLSRFMSLCGSPFQIPSINEFKGDTIVSNKNFELSFKEFHIKYKQQMFNFNNDSMEFQTKRGKKNSKSFSKSMIREEENLSDNSDQDIDDDEEFYREDNEMNDDSEEESEAMSS